MVGKQNKAKRACSFIREFKVYIYCFKIEKTLSLFFSYLGRCRLEGGVGVASGGRLFGLPAPPEITVGVWSFLTLEKTIMDKKNRLQKILSKS